MQGYQEFRISVKLNASNQLERISSKKVFRKQPKPCPFKFIPYIEIDKKKPQP